MDNSKIYQLETLPRVGDRLPLMYARDYKNRLVFHADLNKLIDYWRFDISCLPSFLDKNIPVAKFNPDEARKDLSLKQKIFGYESDREKQNEDYKASILEKDKYKNSSCYKSCYEWLYMPKYDLAKGLTPMGMPIIDMLDLKKYTIEVLKPKRFLCFEYDESIEIDSCNNCIAFKDGRHRTRFLEFIGSKDIFVLIRENQYSWFRENCSYTG